jgi:replicative DNA helicase
MTNQKQQIGLNRFTPEREALMLDYVGEDRVVKFSEKQNEILLAGEAEIKMLTGFPKLDEWISHFEPGDVVTISGPTKSGKTLLAQTITCNLNEQDIGVLWFSYELTAKQFLVSFPELPPHAYMPRIMKAGAMDWVEERIYEALVKSDGKVKAVFIDHLHFLVDMAVSQNMSLQIGTILRNLKRIAQEYKVCIFLIAHTGKIAKGVDPDGENIRDSSFIRQESDTVLIIWRIVAENQAKLMVDVCRRTGAFKKLLIVEKKNKLLREVFECPQIN